MTAAVVEMALAALAAPVVALAVVVLEEAPAFRALVAALAGLAGAVVVVVAAVALAPVDILRPAVMGSLTLVTVVVATAMLPIRIPGFSGRKHGG